MTVIFEMLCLVPAFYLFALTAMAYLQRVMLLLYDARKKANPISGHIVFILPSHNEAENIGNTVKDLLGQTDENFSVHVVADNCTDSTASAARAAGAVVWERFDDTKRSKGYAMEWAIPQIFQWAADNRGGAEIVSIVDADATLSQNSSDLARREMARGNDVLQSEYVLSPGSTLRSKISVVAFASINVVRGLGRRFWNSTDFLKGNGMWFRADVLKTHPWRSYSLAEDFEYSLDLVKAKKRVVCLAGSRVTGLPAASGKGLADQRVRWEAGRLALVLKSFGPAVKRCFRQPTTDNLEVVLELATPPLAYLVCFYLVMFLLKFHVMAFVGIALVVIHVSFAIPIAGLSFRYFFVLLGAPFYVGWKVMLLPKIWLQRRSKKWVRAER